MQILGTIVILLVSKIALGQNLEGSTFIFVCLFVEHTISYFSTIFR